MIDWQTNIRSIQAVLYNKYNTVLVCTKKNAFCQGKHRLFPKKKAGFFLAGVPLSLDVLVSCPVTHEPQVPCIWITSLKTNMEPRNIHPIFRFQPLAFLGRGTDSCVEEPKRSCEGPPLTPSQGIVEYKFLKTRTCRVRGTRSCIRKKHIFMDIYWSFCD